jgi:hypothetical protein
MLLYDAEEAEFDYPHEAGSYCNCPNHLVQINIDTETAWTVKP